ncbi:cation diffusion facilitator family transporter [Micromonospora sp. CPCC 205561]|uniref:cation diffusion facilitator family transporter n=1 Tax=Micromonospora sp. CPCC 205561 TaxID=3122407 RepID=UPI002FF04A57
MVVAGAANLAIAVAKLVAGLISGCAAMLSEAVHSVADTTTEVLLYLALRRGARPPTPDTLQDGAALVGLVLAAAGVALSQLTGDELWDGVASVLIGVLLLVVATILGRSNISLLVGRSVPERLRGEIADELAGLPAVRRVDTLLTMQLGPGDVLVAAKVDFDDEASGAAIEAAADQAERRLTAHHPHVRYVFLDPTGTPGPTEPGGPGRPGGPGAAAGD